MRKRILWIAAALVLIAIPAVIGLVALRGDDGSPSATRRAGALVDLKMAGQQTAVLDVGAIAPGGQLIVVESWSWGEANAASGDRSTAGATAGKAMFNDFSFTKGVDDGSAGLLKACATGQHLPLVTLTLRKPARGPQPYMTIKFTDVIVSSVQQSGGGGDVPTESVSLNYAKIEFSHAEITADGTLGAPTKMGYDLAMAKAL